MQIEYLVDDRQTGRTTELLEDMLVALNDGKNAFFVTHSAEAVIFAAGWLKDHGIDRAWPRVGVGTEYSIRNGHLRGKHIDALYIDNAEYINAPLMQVIQAIHPVAERIVVVLQGETYKRKACKLS